MFKKKLLSTSVAMLAALSAAQVLAADAQKEEAIEEIVVSGIRESLTKAIDLKRESTQVTDSIVAEDIGKFPDNNVVEALSRVTGIQVTGRGSGETGGIAIRGLSDITTTVNGRNIFTAAGSQVALQDIPASLIRQVDVYKTRSASQIEAGLAGAIDVKTARPFDFDGAKFVFAGRGIYEEQASFVDPVVSGLASNRWDTSVGEFGALVNVSMSDRHYRNQGVTAGAMVPFATEAGAIGATPYKRLFDQWTPGLHDGLNDAAGATMQYNGAAAKYILGRDAVFQNDETGQTQRPAANISLQYAPNDTSEYTFEAFYNGYRNDNFNDLFFSFADWWGAYENSTPSQAAAQANVVLYPGTNIVKSRTVDGNWIFTSGDLTSRSTDSYMYALSGSWQLSDDLKLKSELVMQDSTYESSFFAMRFDRGSPTAFNNYRINVDFNHGGGIPSFSFVDNPATSGINEADMTDPSAYFIADLYDNASKDSGDAKTWTADFTYDKELAFFESIDFGVRVDQRGALTEYSRQNGCCAGEAKVSLFPGLYTVNSNFFDGRADVPTSWVAANGYYIKNNADKIRAMYGFTKQSLKKSFDIDELTTSAYVSGKVKTELFGRELGGEVGLRYTAINRDSKFYDEQYQKATPGSTETAEFLPSLSLVYKLTDDLQARFAATKNLRYTSFGDVNPVIFYNEDVTGIGYGTAGGGNADLKPTTSTNIDLGLEWYFAESSALTATLFNRDVKDLVVSYRRPVTHAKSATDSTPYTFILSQPYNASEGYLRGLEVGATYFPKDLPAYLDGFGVQVSGTWLDSEQTTPKTNDAGVVIGEDKADFFGVSKSSYSAILAYEKDKIGARLSYTWRSAFLSRYEAALFANPIEMWNRPEASMDMQLSYKLSEDVTVTLDGTNLTNEMYQSYYGKDGATTRNFNTFLNSRTFAVGIRASF